MSEKPKFNPSETFVLDNDMIDELDELSLTSVIRDFEVSSDADKATAQSTRERDQQPDDSDGDDDGDSEFVLTLLDD